jgi:hypothetical protein
MRAADSTADGEIEAFFDPSALPNPWPLGILSILFSLVTGLSQYKFNVPKLTLLTKVGWGFTLLRSLGLGVSAVLSMHKGNYSGVSSDGFLALFSNVVGLMAANRDYQEFWWAAGGVLAMLFGLLPRLVQLSLALWKPNNENSFAPFRWSDGTRCIIDISSECNTQYPEYNVPYCPVPVLQKGGAQSLLTFVDYVRLVAWLFVFFLCITGIARLFKKEGAKIMNRNAQVIIAYVALIFSVILVIASAIIYAQGLRQKALDCRAATACTDLQPLPCPSIIVFTPRSGNGFFREWTKQLTGKDIPAILI